MSVFIDRRTFLGLSAALLAFRKALATPKAKDDARAVAGDLNVRFLGTGVGPMGAKGDESGDWRRHTSILLDGRVLVDYTAINRETLPSGCRPEAVFYTHSHPDHYNVEAAIELGVKRVYCHESWVDGACAQFKEARSPTAPIGIVNGRRGENRTPEWDDLLAEAKASSSCTMRFHS